MKSSTLLINVLLTSCLLNGVSRTVAAQAANATPYASLSAEAETYRGSERSAARDVAGKVVKIGIFAPLQGEGKSEGEAMVVAGQPALQDASRTSPSPHHRSTSRVALTVEDSSGPAWGAGSDALIRMVLKDDAIALITSTSGTDAHLCEQVGNRIGVSVLTLSADATTTQINIPWIFRIGPSDLQQAQLLAHDIKTVRGLRRVLLITQRGYDGDRAVEAMRQAASEDGALSVDSVVTDGTPTSIRAAGNRIQSAVQQAVVIWTDGATATRLMPVPETQGGDRVFYLPEAVVAAEGQMSLPSTYPAHDPAWRIERDGNRAFDSRNFELRFQRATGNLPSITARETYDAVMLTLHALQSTGPNRIRVRDSLAQTHDYNGVSGTLSFDRQGNDHGSLKLVPVNPAR